MGRHDHFHGVFGVAIARRTFHQDLVNIAVVKVANRAFDQVTLFINRRRSGRLQGKLTNLFPHTLQIFIIAFDFRLRAFRASRPHNQTGPFGHNDCGGDFFQFLAVSCIGNFAAYSAAARSIWHQNAIAPRERQICRQSGAFVAALFFDHLDQHDLAHFDHFLDLITPWTRLAHRAHIFAVIFLGDRFDPVIGLIFIFLIGILRSVQRRLWLTPLFRARRCRLRLWCNFCCIIGFFGFWSSLRQIVLEQRSGSLPLFIRRQINGLHPINHPINRGHIPRFNGVRAVLRGGFCPAFSRAFGFLCFLLSFRRHGFRIGFFFRHERFTIRNWDLIVIRMDFREGQKAVAISAIVNKSGLQRGFNPRYFCQIYVASYLPFVL